MNDDGSCRALMIFLVTVCAYIGNYVIYERKSSVVISKDLILLAVNQPTYEIG